ncbi:thymidylate kinase [Patescibacteria group bacterium]|nr:thymidylate kinase [Patescibacteria group bacterium]
MSSEINKGGLIVAFEGLPGVGKTAVINRLSPVLIHKGYRVSVTDIESAPGSSQILEIAKTYPQGSIDRSLLLWSLRIKQYEVTKQQSWTTDLVIMDRSWGTVLAYDYYGNNLPLSLINYLGSSIDNIVDLTLLLDAPLDIVRERKLAASMQDLVYAQKVARGYHDLAREKGWTIIDARQTTREIVAQVADKIIGYMAGTRTNFAKT